MVQKKKITEMENQPQEELSNLIHYGKKRKTTQMVLDFSIPACLQNLNSSLQWRKGDPNIHTTPHYDFVWILWVLRQVFPKDVVTHLMNLVGGMTFFCERYSDVFSREGLSYACEERMELDFFPKRMSSMSTRRLYLNISVDTLIFEKGKIYIWYKDGKRYLFLTDCN